MAEKSEKQLVVGILAHVDSGKTTLSEAMLYRAGSIRKLGRVDNKDAFLDTDRLEKARGITIFSKQALLKTGSTNIHGCHLGHGIKIIRTDRVFQKHWIKLFQFT